MRTSIHSGGTGKHPAFPTQWFYGFLRALPGDHRFVDPVIRATRWRPPELDACFGAPEPHGFTVRNRKALVSRPVAATASRPAFMTIAIRPFRWDETAWLIAPICDSENQNIFSYGTGQPKSHQI
jgi:hypothetical protein